MKIDTIAHVAMIEDDLGRLQSLVDYTKGRGGDIKPHVTQFARDTWLLDGLPSQMCSVDLFLLDVRLPNEKAELRKTPPEKRIPRGVQLAMQLSKDPRTSSVPVVVYTQFANEPDVELHLARLANKRRCANVVKIFYRLQPVRQTLLAGMIQIRHLDVDWRRVAGHSSAMYIIPGPKVSIPSITSGRILLNGHRPEVVTELRDTRKLWVGFDLKALHELDDNYLMVEAEGRKSIFRV